MTTFPRTLALTLALATSTIGLPEEKTAPKPISYLSHILVQPGAGTGVRFDNAEVKPLTPGDLAAIADSKRCPSIVAAAPIIRARTEVVYKSKKWIPIYTYGSTPEFLKVRDWQKLAGGKPFAKAEVDNQARVCLLGKTVVAKLFGDEDPVGKELRLQNVSFKVVGVLRPKGANLLGLDQDDIMLVPWTTLKYRALPITSDKANSLSDVYPNPGNIYPAPAEKPKKEAEKLKLKFVSFDSIEATARSLKEIPQAVQEIRKALREERRLKSDQEDDFNIRDLSEIFKLHEKKR